MKPRLDMNKIAHGLRAEHKGKVSAGGGYFGAMQLLADIETRFRVPAGGGRATDPDWTERRLVPLAPRTLKRLEAITEGVRARSGVSVDRPEEIRRGRWLRSLLDRARGPTRATDRRRSVAIVPDGVHRRQARTGAVPRPRPTPLSAPRLHQRALEEGEWPRHARDR
jgi:hypothetical protein